jgi:hypothetical protein
MTVTWSLSEIFSRAAAKHRLDPELERWRSLLYWAAQTPHYWAQSAVLADASVLSSATAIRAALRNFEPLSIRQLLSAPSQFRSGYSRPSAPQPIWTFWDTPARVVAVNPWFRCSEPCRTLAKRQAIGLTARDVDRFEPDVLVASPANLLRLSRYRIRSPQRALIAIQAPGMRALTEGERDWLWRRFQVPLYQQLRGFQGELLAAECDAQVGFHANPAQAHWEVRNQELVYTSLTNLRHPTLRLESGWKGDLETSRCGCGCLSARLFPYDSKALVRTGRVELPRVAPLEPKSSASASSATFAQGQTLIVAKQRG